MTARAPVVSARLGPNHHLTMDVTYISHQLADRKTLAIREMLRGKHYFGEPSVPRAGG